jgi:hypothetical protein
MCHFYCSATVLHSSIQKCNNPKLQVVAKVLWTKEIRLYLSFRSFFKHAPTDLIAHEHVPTEHMMQNRVEYI